MRYMLLIYDAESQWASMNEQQKGQMFQEYMTFTDGIKKSGHYVSGDPLQPIATATTVRVRNGKTASTDGPFAETKELIAGFWLWQVRSMEEAVEWLKRAPFSNGEEVEIRRVFEAADFGAELTPEMREQDARLRAQSAAQKKGA